MWGKGPPAARCSGSDTGAAGRGLAAEPAPLLGALAPATAVGNCAGPTLEATAPALVTPLRGQPPSLPIRGRLPSSDGGPRAWGTDSGVA